MIGAADPPDPERSRTVTPVPHYLRTFQHLAPAKERPVRPRRARGRTWAGVSVLALLALTLVRRPTPDAPPVTATQKRADAPRIALAPSPRPAPTDAPAPQVVERQGPTLIEKLLADKFGTPLPPPQAAPPPQPEELLAAAPKPPPPAPPPAVAPAAEPAVIASLPAQLTTRLTDPARAASEARTKPAPEKPKAVAKPEPAKPKVAAKPTPAPPKPKVAAKPEPAAPKPQVVAAAEPAIQRQVAAKVESPPPAPVQVQERPVEVARVEAAKPAEPAERVVAAVPAPPVVVASVPRAEPANTASAEAADVERIAAVRTPPPNPSGPSQDAVRVLLDRYAAAWRGHDVDTLRAIGQVTNDGQASALRAYFANVGDLEVEVRVLDIRSDGNRATVRFTRRDRFRDPAGREIAKESPPIEKNVVTTPQGLRFASGS
jgi:hypothetical protein